MSVLIFLAVLVLLILVHEFGHFIVAKKSGVRVDEFGIGFPPKVFGKKYGETEYTLNWLPIGGFVRIWGEDPTEEVLEGPDQERSFVNKPRYIQAAILVAGVAMNVVLAYVLFVVAFMIGMPTGVNEDESRERLAASNLYVTSVMPDSPAASALADSDQILAVRSSASELASNGDLPLMPSAVAAFIAEQGTQELTFDVERGGEQMSVSLTPLPGVFENDPNRVAAGFSMDLVMLDSLPIHHALIEATDRTWDTLQKIVVGLSTLVGQMVKGTADYSQVAGPVGIVGYVGDAAALGLSWLITFTAFISLNLAVINLLPIPALDGGRLVLVGVEAVIRRPINPIVATRMNQVGFVFLLGLMAIVTIQDVLKLF